MAPPGQPKNKKEIKMKPNIKMYMDRRYRGGRSVYDSESRRRRGQLGPRLRLECDQQLRTASNPTRTAAAFSSGTSKPAAPTP